MATTLKTVQTLAAGDRFTAEATNGTRVTLTVSDTDLERVTLDGDLHPQGEIVYVVGTDGSATFRAGTIAEVELRPDRRTEVDRLPTEAARQVRDAARAVDNAVSALRRLPPFAPCGTQDAAHDRIIDAAAVLEDEALTEALRIRDGIDTGDLPTGAARVADALEAFAAGVVDRYGL